jgi:hypothetical protein
MKTKDKRPHKKTEVSASSKREKLSLYPLSVEDALRAAAQTGRPPPLPKPERPKQQRKKRAKPT